MKAALFFLLFITLLLGCVDAFDPNIRPTANVLVVDATVNDLPEEQSIFLSLAQADPASGRFGQTPATGARVTVLVNGATLVTAAEKAPGEYVLPADFRGRVGNRYQLRVTLGEGAQYVSTEQTMPAPVPLGNVVPEFNPQTLDSVQYRGYRAGHDLLVDFQDPPAERNYYRWEWIDYERQYFCASCTQGMYSIFKPLIARSATGFAYFAKGTELLEACFTPAPSPNNLFNNPDIPFVPNKLWYYDYFCRTACWERIWSVELSIFSDELNNGKREQRRRAGAVPFFTRTNCLVELRQFSLTPEAYSFFNQLQQQTQNTGGIADTPPTAPIGNVRDVANPDRGMVGFFTAAGVSTQRIWLDRRDATVRPLGNEPPGGTGLPGEELFYALNQRGLSLEPQRFPMFEIVGDNRVPTAICRESRTRTAFRPVGWRSF